MCGCVSGAVCAWACAACLCVGRDCGTGRDGVASGRREILGTQALVMRGRGRPPESSHFPQEGKASCEFLPLSGVPYWDGQRRGPKVGRQRSRLKCMCQATHPVDIFP